VGDHTHACYMDFVNKFTQLVTVSISEIYSTKIMHTFFARSNTEIVGSNPTRGMNVCIYSVFVLGSAQGFLPGVLD
jgi:hypothetical protein